MQAPNHKNNKKGQHLIFSAIFVGERASPMASIFQPFAIVTPTISPHHKPTASHHVVSPLALIPERSTGGRGSESDDHIRIISAASRLDTQICKKRIIKLRPGSTQLPAAVTPSLHEISILCLRISCSVSRGRASGCRIVDNGPPNIVWRKTSHVNDCF